MPAAGAAQGRQRLPPRAAALGERSGGRGGARSRRGGRRRCRHQQLGPDAKAGVTAVGALPVGLLRPGVTRLGLLLSYLASGLLPRISDALVFRFIRAAVVSFMFRDRVSGMLGDLLRWAVVLASALKRARDLEQQEAREGAAAGADAAAAPAALVPPPAGEGGGQAAGGMYGELVDSLLPVPAGTEPAVLASMWELSIEEAWARSVPRPEALDALLASAAFLVPPSEMARGLRR